MVRISFLIPREWRDALLEAAHVQSVSMADLCRLVLRRFLRERYADDDRGVLEGGHS